MVAVRSRVSEGQRAALREAAAFFVKGVLGASLAFIFIVPDVERRALNFTDFAEFIEATGIAFIANAKTVGNVRIRTSVDAAAVESIGKEELPSVLAGDAHIIVTRHVVNWASLYASFIEN